MYLQIKENVTEQAAVPAEDGWQPPINWQHVASGALPLRLVKLLGVGLRNEGPNLECAIRHNYNPIWPL
jgi:hypothetical protein